MADDLTDTSATDTTEGADTVTEGSTLLGGDTSTEDTSTETQTEGETTETKDDAKPEGAPESYTDFTLPEGVTIDSEVDAELKALAKDLNLPQDQAQRLADLGAKQAQRFVQQQQQSLADASAEWVAAAKSDPEFGGDKIDASLGVASKAIEKFGTPALKELLNQSQLGNHPEFIRFAYRAGMAISEDSFVSGDRNSRGETPLAQRMYPNSNHA